MTEITEGAEAFGEGMKADKETDVVTPELSLKDIRLLLEVMELAQHNYTDAELENEDFRKLHARLTRELR